MGEINVVKSVLLIANEFPLEAPETHLALALAQREQATLTGFVAVNVEDLQSIGPAAAGAFSYKYQIAQERLEHGLTDSRRALGAVERLAEERGFENFRPMYLEGDRDRLLVDVWRFQDIAFMSTKLWTPGLKVRGDAAAVLSLVARGLRPLIAVPPTAERTDPQSALICLSGSLDSAKAFKQFLALNLFGDLPLHIVTIGQPKSGESPQALLAQATEYARAVGYTQVEPTALDTPNDGDRVKVITGHARKIQAGIIVSGSSYRHFLVMTRFGTHALGLLDSSPVPVFVSH
jgi:nucleotide-binding universal stress UspA family protein